MMNVADEVRLREVQKANAELRRAKELRDNNGLYFYRPHFKQHRFHEMGQVTGRYCRFGNRTGKTVCGSAEDVAWLYGGRVWYRSSFDILKTRQEGDGSYVSEVWGRHEGHRDHSLVTHGIPQRAVKGLLVVSDWKKAKEIFTERTADTASSGELFQLIPKDAIGHIGTSQGNIVSIEVFRHKDFGGGSSILYISTVESYKHANLSAESSDYDFIHYDEPPPQKMFVANKRGLTDRNGKFWINATPVSEQWVNDEFCPPKGQNLKVESEGVRFNKTDRGGDRFIITATIFDNPYINDTGRAEFEASLSKEEKQCRLMGLPLNLAGLVYKQFHYDVHVLSDVPKGWKDFYTPPSNYTIRVAWDVHDAIPQAILFVATAPTGESFFYDEIFADPLIGPNAELLKEKLRGRIPCDYLIDPKAVIPSPVTGESVLDTLMEFDLYFDKGSKDMALGISKTREKLEQRRIGLDGVAHPTLYFAPTCETLLWEIARYCYNQKTQKPNDKDDHMCENMRRLVLTGLEYVEPPSDLDYVRRNTNMSMNELSVPQRR